MTQGTCNKIEQILQSSAVVICDNQYMISFYSLTVLKIQYT